jgi:hypothetical protein
MKHILKKCPFCGEVVIPGEPIRVTNDGLLTFHSECFTRMIVGSVSHQLHQCCCYGGHQEDPPEWTRRQAAKAASDLYHHGYYESPTDQSSSLLRSIPKPSLN